ncbi:MAG: hypothetical protein LBP53_00440 [Candidatus Peribacteria bacterium]|nr:hypothetical protein [Candidatus Peribacteria bacterium]
MLPFIRTEVAKRLKGEHPNQIAVSPTSSPFSSRLKKLQETQPELLKTVLQLIRERYKGILPQATNFINKLAFHYTENEIKNLITQQISVLLYELTTNYKTFEIGCEGGCSLTINGTAYQQPQATITRTTEGMFIQIPALGNAFPTENIVISSLNQGLVSITNYSRKSYANIPRNTFRGTLIFQKDRYQAPDGTLKNGFVVINQLPFSEYLKGIVETNDQEHLEKNKVMALIAKNYALFYLNNHNLHPNIPAEASYDAIDSPEMFQKYVGAGAEKTLTKRYEALEATKHQVVLYSGMLPILPYFSCSAGFTLSALEKRGWKDTPYLQSVFDFAVCPDFEGHGVGLAGKGAEYFAQKGMKADEILQRYYPSVAVVDV